MTDDPVVTEVREARRKLYEACQGDLEMLMDRMKQAQQQSRDRVVTADDLRTAAKS